MLSESHPVAHRRSSLRQLGDGLATALPPTISADGDTTLPIAGAAFAGRAAFDGAYIVPVGGSHHDRRPPSAGLHCPATAGSLHRAADHLEEAEALCSAWPCSSAARSSRWRAWKSCSSRPPTVLQFKTDEALPETIAARARVTGRIVQIPGPRCWRRGAAAGRFRQGGVQPQEVDHRADLEDVFLRGPRKSACHSPG